MVLFWVVVAAMFSWLLFAGAVVIAGGAVVVIVRTRLGNSVVFVAFPRIQRTS